mgnify:FL=1|jgi:PLP dependent protein|tara:strand:+ start:1587 stop:2255 length:669 start_codon:yes stop_codon:yes gene_type:complete
MHDVLKQLDLITNKVNDIINTKQLKTKPKIIAVTKTFPMDKITPLLESGHIHFGENKLQEAEDKWLNVKSNYKHCRLHMIGKLQSNKAKKAVKLFDYIHSLDNEKLASKIFQYQKELNKSVSLFIQVNLANETQKSGITLRELDNFYNYCTKELSLNIIGLMCLPPFDTNSEKYFKTIEKSAHNLNLSDLSIGMSSDYEKALLYGSTYLRLGTVLMGERKAI